MIKILLCVDLVLLATVFILIKIINKKNETIKKLELEIEQLEKRRGVEKSIKKETEKINTSDNNTNFTNTIQLLQKYSHIRN